MAQISVISVLSGKVFSSRHWDTPRFAPPQPLGRFPANREKNRGECERLDTPNMQNLDSTGLS
jgi:hypothetical protein